MDEFIGIFTLILLIIIINIYMDLEIPLKLHRNCIKNKISQRTVFYNNRR